MNSAFFFFFPGVGVGRADQFLSSNDVYELFLHISFAAGRRRGGGLYFFFSSELPFFHLPPPPRHNTIDGDKFGVFFWSE